MICGGVAGACLWTAIYPVDVIKSRIQVQSLVGPMPGFLSTTIKTYKTEGKWLVIKQVELKNKKKSLQLSFWFVGRKKSTDIDVQI